IKSDFHSTIPRSLFPLGERGGLTFWLAQPEDYDEVMAISDNIYQGMDYLPYRYKNWMTEPNRVVIIARKEGNVVALQSGILADEGQTIVLEGLRVSPSERGRGIAGIMQRFMDDYIRQIYPSVRVKRITRKDALGPEILAKFSFLARRVTKLSTETGAGDATLEQKPILVELDREQVKKVLLDPDIASQLDLPGGVIIQDWQPLKPVESNLEILGRKSLTWLADRLYQPSFLSFHTPPYPVPYKGGSLNFNIDMYGRNLDLACWALLIHLQRVKYELMGTVVVRVYMHHSLREGLNVFCQCPGLQKDWEKWEQFLLEQNL
uniref:N-acetyltransferase 16, like n=1 Tax=Scleropages formosus TaxID=113540 RepID=A0A8C9RQ42_SCLFO